jgi:hypothetical protein
MLAALWLGMIGPATAHAQLNTQHIKGTVGLKAGSQPPPHLYVVLPLVYAYNTDTVRTADGRRLPFPSFNTVAYAAGVNKVTTKKLLGAYYGFQVLFPAGVNNRLQGTEIDQDPGAGLTDSAVQPLSLGWHFKRADAIAGYAIFVPTGRYTDGATNNTGFGMWGHELSFGTTVYMNEAKQYHAATVVTFDFQSKKEDSDTKVGNTMNLEGGVGADFLKGGLSVGLAYYASFKLTRDQLGGFAPVIVTGKNKAFALGPEATLALAKNDTVYGFLKVNYQWETYARTATQGREFNIILSLLFPALKVK